ncbi:MAG: hypothetical protein WC683_04080 [bacterium]
MRESPVNNLCGFAEAGTYGHECGKPGVLVAVKRSEMTEDGLFFSGRCEAHSKRTDGEGRGVLRYEPYAGQTNKWT